MMARVLSTASATSRTIIEGTEKEIVNDNTAFIALAYDSDNDRVAFVRANNSSADCKVLIAQVTDTTIGDPGTEVTLTSGA